MAEHKPLPNQNFLSKAKTDWLAKPCGSKSMPRMIRFTMIMNVMSTTSRPTNPSQSIMDQAYTGEKLHDREPGLIVMELERRIPGFFDTLPKKSRSTSETQKRAFLSDVIRHFLHNGWSKYGKPKLRGSESDVIAVA